ncbi:hypothetical protein EIP86_007925 [Pleurotus ostreatoroseus]|nr:hypothetical protein EIP86_007925 [Pleurotus ostreatoroseus]
MEAPGSPREASPAVAVLTVTSNHPHTSKKRKHGAISSTAAPSPAPSDRGGTPNPGNDNHVLPTKHTDLSTRPRLTISRHPQFVPIAPGSPFCSTEPLCLNRLNFRYTPAGLTGSDTGNPFRTIESAPQALRVSWEDRSPFVKVTPDGLGLKGDKGFRSARCNAPVREGKWYMEVKIELGGGDKRMESQRREGSHVRLGWARREAPLNGPVGLDGYSYGYRDKSGEKVHLSRPRPYAAPFKSGDVVGMYISLPSPRRQPNKKDPYDPAHVKRERIAIEYKGQEYFESFEYSQSKEMLALMEASDRGKASSSTPAPPSTKKSATVKNLPSTARGTKTGPTEPTPMRPLPTLGPESCIAFFVNGECQGIAFRDLYDFLPLRTPPNKAHEKKRGHKDGLREHKENPFDDGSLGYYPMISLFNGAEVKLNPGPNFDFPPPPDIDAVLVNGSGEADIKPPLDSMPRWRPLSERYGEYMDEQFALDKLEDAEAATVKKGKPLPAAQAASEAATPAATPAPTKHARHADKAKADGAATPVLTPALSSTPVPAAASARDSKHLSDQEKLELHRAKRRAQAARRRERARAAKEQAEAEARETKRRKAGQDAAASTSRAASEPEPDPEHEHEPDAEPKPPTAPAHTHADADADEMDPDAELAMLIDDRGSSNPPEPETEMDTETPLDTPHLPVSAPSRISPGSVGDVQAYWTGVPRDNSEYNTEYEEAGAEGEVGTEGGDDQARDDSEMGIDEELAQLA